MSEAGDGIGSLATGALWARTFGRGEIAAHAEADEAGACANCGTERVGPYCHACGQVGHVHRNLSALVHDIAHGVFHFEGKLWTTLPLLAWHPGRLTRRYVDGERAKFVSPMALFLFSVFLMFAVVSNMTRHHNNAPKGPASTATKNGVAGALAQATAKLGKLEAARAATGDAKVRAILDKQISDAKSEVNTIGMAQTAGALLGNASGDEPAKDKSKIVHLDTGWSWLDNSVRGMSANPELTLYKMKTYGYKYSWALIPISLPFIWVLFPFRRDVGLYDHAIFSIYSLSFMSLGVVVLTLIGRIGISSGLITLAAMLIPPVHMYRQLKGTYGLGRYSATWRTCALLIMTAISSSLFIAFLFWMGSE